MSDDKSRVILAVDEASPGGDKSVMVEAQRYGDGRIVIVSIGEFIEGEVVKSPPKRIGRASE